jgi:Cd2+/Zn2+-exporting ATPase
MIGRFASLGVYRELGRSQETYRLACAGLFIVVGYYWNWVHETETLLGMALITASLALNGIPIVWEAVKGLWQRRVNVDELVALAIVASIVQGEILAAAAVSFVMVLGSLIEEATTGSARKAIQALINITPQTATRLENGNSRTIPIAEVQVGDILLMKPGERIPVDAVIVRGSTAVDESSITGEPIPRERTIGDTVFAGTLNQNGVIEIETTQVRDNTTLGKIIKLVSSAEAYKPQATKMIDRYAQWFTPTILFCAGIVWGLTGEMSRAVTVLIVGCPCALILAAPTAIVAAIGRAAKSGILIKGGRFLEEAGRANVVLFDKTGTLTQGEPRVSSLVAVEGVEVKDVLSCAASVEQDSTHPLARAVLKAAHYARVVLARAEEMVAEIGLGVRACVNGRVVEVGSVYIGGGTVNLPVLLRQQVERIRETGETPLLVCEDQAPIGVIAVSDPVRTSARETVARLRSLNIERVGVVSGDHDKAVTLIANAVGLTDAWSEQKPEDKLHVIREFQESGKTTIFVGDGINDAPALATANVGIAMGAAGTDVALETADVALMNDDISKIPFLISLGRRTLRTIKWNIALGLVFNALAVIAGGWGLLSPIMAAIVHNVGSVLVVLSSAHLAFVSETTAQ